MAPDTSYSSTTTLCWNHQTCNCCGAGRQPLYYGYNHVASLGQAFELKNIKVTKGLLPSFSIPLRLCTPEALRSVALSPRHEYARRRC